MYPTHFLYGHRLNNYATSAIDISDGFYGDLNKLISESNKGALLNFKSLPFSNRSKKLINKKIINHNYLLTAGDDYELIFTAKSKHSARIKRLSQFINVKITKVGTIIQKKGIFIDNEKFNFINKSFDHFS